MEATVLARRRIINGILALGLVLAAAGLYNSARHNPFMFEDLTAIVNNPDVTEPARYQEQAVGDLWGGQIPSDLRYQPMTVLSFRLNALATSLSAPGFRAVNVALLVALSFLIMVWINGYTHHPTGAWLAAFLFLAHPTHALLINQIVGRSEPLALIGTLGFLLIQQQALTGKGLPPRGLPRLTITAVGTLAAVFSASVALFSSRTGLLLLPLAAVTAWVQPRFSRTHPRVESPKPQLPGHHRWAVHLAAVICLAVPIWLYLQGHRVMVSNTEFSHRLDPPRIYSDLTANPLVGAPTSQRLASSVSLAWFYTKQLVWPNTRYNLAPVDLPTWSSGSTLLGAIVLCLLVAAGLALLKRRHWLLLAVVLALGQHLLSSHVMSAGPVYASNLMMPPYCLAAVTWLAQVIDRLTLDSVRRRALAVVPTALCVTLMAWSVSHTNMRWLSSRRLILLETPPDKTHAPWAYLRGKALMDWGNYRDAEYWLDLAVQLKPDSLQARQSLAMAQELEFEPDMAVEQYHRILHQNPNDLHAHLRLAALAQANNDLDLATEHVLAARRICPFHMEVMYALAHLERLMGRTDQALRRYEQLLARHPNHTLGRQEYLELKRNPDPR